MQIQSGYIAYSTDYATRPNLHLDFRACGKALGAMKSATYTSRAEKEGALAMYSLVDIMHACTPLVSYSFSPLLLQSSKFKIFTHAHTHFDQPFPLFLEQQLLVLDT